MPYRETERHRVLVVDDNRAIHEDFRKILVDETSEDLDELEAELFDEPARTQHATFELDSAFRGEEGYELVVRALDEGRPYALAFVDMRMPPGWDGLETIDRLWREDPDLQTVICTAYSDHTWGEIVDRLGRSDRLLILKKPFDNIEVEQIAHALSQKWRIQRHARDRLNELERILSRRESALSAAKAELSSRVEVPADVDLEIDLASSEPPGDHAALTTARLVRGLEVLLSRIRDLKLEDALSPSDREKSGAIAALGSALQGVAALGRLTLDQLGADRPGGAAGDASAQREEEERDAA